MLEEEHHLGSLVINNSLEAKKDSGKVGTMHGSGPIGSSFIVSQKVTNG